MLSGIQMSGVPDEMDQLYAINDVLTELVYRFQVAFESDDQQDEVLNDLTHQVARTFRVGPYRNSQENLNAR